MTSRSELVLAYAIATYQTVLDHLDALRRIGMSVPWALTGRIQTEQYSLVGQWQAQHGDPRVGPELVPAVVIDVRGWLTDHVTELDALLGEREVIEER